MKWKLRTLAEIAESVSYGYTASASEDAIGPKFLRITDIVPPQIDWTKVPYCKIDEPKFRKFSLQPGDILIARTGATVGYAKLIRHNEQAVFASYLVRIRIDQDKADPAYVGRIVESRSYRNYVLSRCSGSAQPNANARVLSSFKLYIPERRVQHRIVSILSAYDDLIENNRRRIQLLEQTARLLYKEWFVHLRFPGHEHVTITDGVPEGWERKPFSQVASFLNGFAFKPSHLGDVGLPIVKIPELRDGPTAKTPKNTGEHIPDKYLLDTGDIVFSWSGTLLVNIWNYGKGILNQHLFKVIPAFDNLRGFVYFALNQAMVEFQNQTTGATMQHIRRGALEKVSALVPNEVILNEFEATVAPMLEQASILQRQTTESIKARDLLLPRLMNGELAA